MQSPPQRKPELIRSDWQGVCFVLMTEGGGNEQPVPVVLVTASASGFDPHISHAAAEYQLERVAKYRRMSIDSVRALLAEHLESRQFGILGEPRVNVLMLNLELDGTNAIRASEQDSSQ